jgi:hypothetical protein
MYTNTSPAAQAAKRAFFEASSAGAVNRAGEEGGEEAGEAGGWGGGGIVMPLAILAGT